VTTPRDSSQGTRKRILVVDDDPSICRTLKLGLGKAGYEVIEARDGEEALRLWEDAKADLVITDIHMPRKSGLLLIQDLQGISAFTPVIAMTDGGPAGQLNLLGLADLLGAGAVRTIPKPFTIDEMLALVRQALDRGRA
jgi:DNA-binding response OmpR family regulator